MDKRVFNFDQYVNESYINEDDSINPWENLATMIKDNMPDIEKAVAAEIDDIQPELAKKLAVKLEKDIDESLGLFTVIGGLLSFGKAIELVTLIPKWIANKLDPDKKTWATQLFNWLDEKGNDYTHFIEMKMILPLLKNTPGFKDWFNTLPEKTQETWAKWTLTVLILGLAAKSGVDAYKAFKEGRNVSAGIESALTGVKSTEIASNIAKAVKTTTTSAIDMASVVADVGDEVVDVVDDFITDGADELDLDPDDIPKKS